MNKRTPLVFAIALAVLVGIGIYLAILFPANSNTNYTANTPKTQTSEQKDTPAPAPPETTKEPGKYIKYTEAAYNESTAGRRVLFFHAPWCPQCRQLDKEITAAALPNAVTIFKVDYDTSIPMRAKYGVTLQTTFVEVNESGEKIKGYVAYDEPTYANLSKQFAF